MCNVCTFSSPVSCQHFQMKTGRCLAGRSQGRESGGLGLFLTLSPSHYLMHGSSLLCFHHLPPNSAVHYGLCLGCALCSLGKRWQQEIFTVIQSSWAPPAVWIFRKHWLPLKKTVQSFASLKSSAALQGILTTFPWMHVTSHEGAIIIVVI